MMAAVGCSDSDKDETTGAGGDDGGGKGGTPATAGSTNNGGDPSTDGGTAAGGMTTTPGGAGGADAGGAGAGGADAGGAGGADGVSVAKFCNDLTFGTEDAPMDTTFILEVGTGAAKVTFTAQTGQCKPADGAACTSIPLGPKVPVALFDADDTSAALFEGTIKSEDGDNWIFYTDLSEDAEPSPIAAGQIVTDATCEEYTYDDVYPPG